MALSISACMPDRQEQWSIPAISGFSFYPLQSQELLLLPLQQGNHPSIAAFHLKNGRKAWAFSDSILSNVYYNFQPYLAEQALVLPIGTELLCLNPKTGKLKWRYSREQPGDSHVFGDRRMVYRSYPSPDGTAFQWVGVHIATGKDSVLWSIPVHQAAHSLMRSPMPFYDGRDSGLVGPIIIHEPKVRTSSDILIRRFDPSSAVERHPIYPKNLHGQGASLPPLIDGRQSYWVAGHDIVAYDLAEGTEQWRRTLPHGLLSSRLSLVDDQLFVPCEDEKLYALSTETGALLWSFSIAGTPGRMFHTPRFSYLIGGSDRILYEIDRTAGRVHQRYKCSDASRKLQRLSYFDESVAVLNDGAEWQVIPLHLLGNYLNKMEREDI